MGNPEAALAYLRPGRRDLSHAPAADPAIVPLDVHRAHRAAAGTHRGRAPCVSGSHRAEPPRAACGRARAVAAERSARCCSGSEETMRRSRACRKPRTSLRSSKIPMRRPRCGAARRRFSSEPADRLEAVEAWRRVRLLRQKLGDAAGQLDALEGTARTMRQAGESPEASVSAFEAALDLASTLGEGSRALVAAKRAWNSRVDAGALRRRADALRSSSAPRPRAGEPPPGGPHPQQPRRHADKAGPDRGGTHRRSRRVLRSAARRASGSSKRTRSPRLARCRGPFEQLDRAVQYFEQSLELRRALGDRGGEGWMLIRIAETRAALGNEAAAREAGSAASRIAAETGDAALIAACGSALPR